MADLADHAYALSTAALGAGDPALESAMAAVRRGGRSRTAVLGHARAEVLARAAEALVTGGGDGLDGPVPDDLTELAVALAATRPLLERVVADLDTRHGLDRTALGRALGTTTADAATRAGEVAAGWQRALDPVLLARFGPGGCDGLAVALGAPAEPDGEAADDGAPTERSEHPTPSTLRELTALGPAVLDHAAGCEACSDRLRSMVSVRDLLAQRPIEQAPAPVRAAAAPSRLRRPAPPPPLEPARSSRRTPKAAVLGAVAAVALVVAGGLGLAAARSDDADDGDAAATLEVLTSVPDAGNVLVATPASLDGPRPAPVRLANHSGQTITWLAAPDVPWLTVQPSGGTLEAGDSTDLRVLVAPDAPEGDVRGSVQISGRDGSATVVRVEAVIEHPPDLAATAEGCDVQAVVEDEGELGAVELHWLEPATTGAPRPATGAPRPPVERTAPMGATDAGFVGRLPGGRLPLTWWVTATDARENGARTADAVLAAASC